MTGRRANAGFSRRLFGFAGLPLLSALTPFVVLPLVSRLGGVVGWAAIGVGQSVGALAGVVVIAGWSLYGPSLVAAVGEHARRDVYGDSIIGRALLFVIAAPIAAVVASMLTPPSGALLAALTAIAFSMSGLSPAWYGIGVGRPGLIAAYEIVPRLGGVVVAVALLLLTHDVVVYPISVMGSTLAGIVLFSIRVGRLHRRNRPDLPRVLGRLWRDRFAVLSVIAAGLYSTTPVAIMGTILAVDSVARFSSADRIFRIGLYAIIALGNSFQGWVAEDSAVTISPRMRRALSAHVALALVGGSGIAILSPLVSSILFGARVAVDPWTAVFYGLAFAAISINTSTGGQLLIPLGGAKSVFWSTVTGAVVGVAAMVVFGIAFGGAGGAAGLALGEVAVCLVQAIGLVRFSRSHRFGQVAASI